MDVDLTDYIRAQFTINDLTVFCRGRDKEQHHLILPHFLIIHILTERRPCKDGINSKNGSSQNAQFQVQNEP